MQRQRRRRQEEQEARKGRMGRRAGACPPSSAHRVRQGGAPHWTNDLERMLERRDRVKGLAMQGYIIRSDTAWVRLRATARGA